MTDHPHMSVLGIFAYGWTGLFGVALSEAAEAERFPISYYVATFVGLGLVVSVIRFWSWFEDRQKKEMREVEDRMHKKIDETFKFHNALDEQRFTRIEEMIRRAFPAASRKEG